jgi:hypothetical protein
MKPTALTFVHLGASASAFLLLTTAVKFLKEVLALFTFYQELILSMVWSMSLSVSVI